MPDINSDIQYLKGVGPAYAKKFAKLGIYTIRDLLLHYPRRYIDYSQPYTVVSAPFDVDCCVKATVLQRDPDRRIKGGRMLSHVLAGDDTGMLALSWFNAPYAAEKLEPGTEYYFEGRVGGMMTRREILHPLVRTEAQVAAAPLLPVYGSTEGLPAARLTRCAQLALEYVAQLDDPLPPELLTRYRMPPTSKVTLTPNGSRRSARLAACWRARISVGASMALCQPFCAANQMAAAATSVLPLPTSPCSRRFIGVWPHRSWQISSAERRCAPVGA